MPQSITYGEIHRKLFFTRTRWNALDPCAMIAAMTKRRVFHKTFIREWRKHRGLTLERLADRIDMTASHLSMLERGERPYTQETLELIADALGTTASSLIMRNPNDDAIWSIWEQAQPGQRQMIVDIAKTVLKIGR
jgi:DNA-binding Xre family transcriptional regulator